MSEQTKNHPYLHRTIKSIAVIGNYLPRHCGIATFTTDLVKSLQAYSDDLTCRAIAVNDKPDGYPYPDEVCFEIEQNIITDYHTAAEFLNIHEADVVSLQHEFGIFGGPAGSYIIKLLQQLQMPVVTTLHTVLVEPTKKQEYIMNQLIEVSDRLVVMSQSAVDILHTLYDIPREKITYIPHGIPDLPFVDPNYYKENFGLLGKKVLLTFGLLSENKGIEYVIRGLPKVVERFPNLVYIVLGATHPKVLELEGEQYRTKLNQLVQKLDLEDHVIFKNHFVPFEELCEYLAATDLYITPYNNKEQITSGTLAYAAGTGKAVISTPYWYAKEMLSDGRGRLVPFKDSAAITDAIIGLFEDDAERHQMRKRAYDYNRNSTWKEVGRQYVEVFRQIKLDQNHSPRNRPFMYNGHLRLKEVKLPPLKFDHLLALTDDTGLLQHAKYTIANRNHGYCTDDNARGLIFSMQARQLSQIRQTDAAQLDMLSSRYLSFLLHAFNPETERFRNFMDYSRHWLEQAGSEDSHSRALWALGITVSQSKKGPCLSLCSRLFMRGLKTAESFKSPRAIAFTLIGINSYLKIFSGDSDARRIAKKLAGRLLSKFEENSGKNWPWLENILTYSNGKLPHALIQSGYLLNNDDMIQMGLRTLDWLIDTQTENGHLAPIGNNGWYKREGEKARFDQQPLEVHALIDACIAAYQVTGEERWLNNAMVCFNWFLGYNDLNLPMHDAQSGGCRDGLRCDRINQNQGAESTLAWLLSLTAMYRLSDEEILQFSSSGKLTTIRDRG